MIWQGRHEDLAAAQAVLRAAFDPFTAVIGRPPAPLAADLGAALAAGHLWRAPQAVMVCFAAGDRLELDILAVAPEAQGRGTGAALVAHAEALARAAGLRAVTLHTNAAMAGAQRLYLRLGFAEQARRRQDGFDRVFYAKPVAPTIRDPDAPTIAASR